MHGSTHALDQAPMPSVSACSEGCPNAGSCRDLRRAPLHVLGLEVPLVAVPGRRGRSQARRRAASVWFELVLDGRGRGAKNAEGVRHAPLDTLFQRTCRV